jgi:Hg(II)-responsive transcriptional regulator
MSIGELATATKVKIVTIRYYEQVGLMPAPARTEGNYRSYNNEHAHRLQFIKRLRELGFTLDEVRDLLRLSSEKSQPCDDVDRITNAHLATVEKKLQDLKKLATELRALSKRCKGGGKIAECRIIEALTP